MLMRRARAYSSSCLQVILVYSVHFAAIHSFAAKNLKKITKTPILEFIVNQGHQC